MTSDNQRRKPTREPYCGTSSLVGRVTDNQRREVAQELRELRHTTYYHEEVMENICDAIRIADNVNTFREPEDVYKLLADLIDRPLAHIGVNKHGRGFCTNCGCDDWCIADGSHFCPDCGAELLDD